jgi:hypothetical protein
MPLQTKLFIQNPWRGGLNTSLDESMIPPNQLTVADNVTIDTRPSKKKRPGINHDWDDVTTGTVSIVGLHDFWFGSATKTQRLVSIGSDRTYKSYTTGGVSSSITDAGTAWAGTINIASSITFNNLILFATPDGANNVVKKWSGTGDIADLDGTPPKASFLRQHMGRIFMNDKSNVDRLHYSPVHDHTLWNGSGDSGALDIGVGDGDPDGITAIFPTFKGDLFVAKRTKLYRVITPSNDPADWEVKLVSNGIGCISHNSVVPIENDDIYFVSPRGIHSLVTTANFGDFESSFLSKDIQKTFRDVFVQSRLKYVWGAYDSSINCVGFTFTENPVSGTDSSYSKTLYGSSGELTTSNNNVLYLYNIETKEWHRWGAISCQSLICAHDGSDNKQRFFFGTHISRVSKSKNSTNYDMSHGGSNVSIPLNITTGWIIPDGNQYEVNRLHRFFLYYKPVGTHTITVNVYTDNLSLDSENSNAFATNGSTALLGTTFTLGTSTLGTTLIMGPYSVPIYGHCRAFKVEILQTGTDEQVEIQGFGVEYEPLGPFAEVF